jgi:imidazole glycerol-phosphate synthase subunit HisH
MDKISIVDYGVGNLLSVKQGLQACGAQVDIVSDYKELTKASKVVLPGVGAFSAAMENLNNLKFTEVLKNLANNNVPILGICLGMQLLFDESEEFGSHIGLGILAGKVKKLPVHSVENEKIKVPHIGWSPIIPTVKSDIFFKEANIWMQKKEFAYFVHSYQVIPSDTNIEIAHTLFGSHKVCSIVRSEKIFACQFHPEKSANFGLRVLKDFCNV